MLPGIELEGHLKFFIYKIMCDRKISYQFIKKIYNKGRQNYSLGELCSFPTIL